MIDHDAENDVLRWKLTDGDWSKSLALPFGRMTILWSQKHKRIDGIVFESGAEDAKIMLGLAGIK
jgi:hypothetical protein